MRIAQVRSVWSRVPDPLRPGKHARAERLEDARATSISHELGTFTAGDDGFFDVPPEVARDLLGFRSVDRQWLTEAEIPEGLIVGTPKRVKR